MSDRSPRDPGDSMIRLAGVGKTYADGTVAVHDLDLDVPRGALVVLVGVFHPASRMMAESARIGAAYAC